MAKKRGRQDNRLREALLERAEDPEWKRFLRDNLDAFFDANEYERNEAIIAALRAGEPVTYRNCDTVLSVWWDAYGYHLEGLKEHEPVTVHPDGRLEQP